jgi:hypothetical protein
MVVFQPKLSIIMNWHDVLPIDKDFIVHEPCKLKDCFIKNMSRIQLSVACIYHSGQSWLINTYPQNFIVLVHFWPKLMWTSSIKEAHRDMWFQLSVAYIYHSGQSWLMNIWPQNFVVLVHFWPKLIWARSVKEDESQIKCDLYLLFWSKLINEYLFTKFYCSYLLLAKADVDWINKRS